MSQDDFLTSQKNHVIATNSLVQAWQDYLRAEHGSATSMCVKTATVIAIGPGRIVSVSVVEKGSAGGFIYNESTVETPSDDARLYAIPTETGAYLANFPFTDGLLVVPGTGQAVTVTYTTD